MRRPTEIVKIVFARTRLTQGCVVWQGLANGFMSGASRRMRIDDVARLAGVSPATVSRVLTGSRRVGEEARQRVLSVVARFDYQPSGLARNLRQGRAEVVGVVVSDIENPHFATAVRAIEDAIYLRGKRVILCNTSEYPEKEAAYLQVMASEHVLGVLISPSDPESPEIGRLLDRGIPVVAFDRLAADPRADGVTADNRLAAAMATQHLLQAGRTRVGFVGGRPGVQTADDRLAGYLDAGAKAGLQSWHAAGQFTVADGYAATRQLIRDVPKLDGLVVANNQMTIGALEALRDERVVVPDDVALVAFDDPAWAALVDPPLTTLAQPLREMSQGIVDLLFERMERHRVQPRRLIYDFELRVRRSCGAAAL